MLRLHTKRLALVPLDREQLQLYLEQPEVLEQLLGFPISRAVISERVQRAIRMKLEKMAEANEANSAWYTYWLMVIRDSPFGAGLIGFKGFPDKNGEAEIGYGIDPVCQKKGYTTEAVQTMVRWAFEEPVCLAVVARDTRKQNTASLRVLEKAGMRVYDESEDALWLRVERGDVDAVIHTPSRL